MEIFGILGKARSGKDTAASILVEEFGFTRFAFADPLKDAFAEYHDIPRCYCDGVDEGGNPVDREIQTAFHDLQMYGAVTIRQGLQRFGEAMRVAFGEDFWVNVADDLMRAGGGERIVLTDVRYDNEVALVRDLGGVILGIDRPGVEDVAAHKSEDLAKRLFEPGLCDTVISNGGTLEEFQDEVRNWMRGK